MSGRKAKQLRKRIYQDQSVKGPRKYLRTPDGSIVNVGIRAAYRYVKEAEKRGEMFRGLLYEVCYGSLSKDRTREAA